MDSELGHTVGHWWWKYRSCLWAVTIDPDMGRSWRREAQSIGFLTLLPWVSPWPFHFDISQFQVPVFKRNIYLVPLFVRLGQFLHQQQEVKVALCSFWEEGLIIRKRSLLSDLSSCPNKLNIQTFISELTVKTNWTKTHFRTVLLCLY